MNISVLDSKPMKQSVREAISGLSSLVGATLGPGGRPILIDQGDGKILVTKDGVSCSRYVDGQTDIGKVVVAAAKEVCERTARLAGDGTTTAIVLAAALVEEGHRWLEKNPDYSPQNLSRVLKMLLDEQVKPFILSLSKPIRGLTAEEAKIAVRHVAMVSSNHDAEIANAVAEAHDLVGEDGMVIAEEGAGSSTSVVHREGFPIQAGLKELGPSASLSFINRKEFGDCLVEGAHVALYDGDVNDFNHLIPLFEQVLSELDEGGRPVNAPIVLIAHKFSDQVLKMMSTNFRAGKLRCIPFVTPRNGQSHYKQQFLHDFVAYCGGVVYDPQALPIRDANLSGLGFVEEVRLGMHESVFMTSPNADDVTRRIEELKKQMDGASDFDAEKLRHRVSQLTGGVATIYAGGTTTIEARERHARVVDAISAVRSAMDLGVVPGGGVALVVAARDMCGNGPSGILFEALKKPFYQILRNTGLMGDISYYERNVGPFEGKGFVVFDALKSEFLEWYSGGIMDPTRVTLTALDNALSVAQLLMTLGGVIYRKQTEGAEQVKQMQEAVLKAVNEGEIG